MPACASSQTDQFIAGGIVPKKIVSCGRKFRHFSKASEPVEATSVSYRGTAPADKMSISIRDFPHIA
jgi:hypothetical protein